jgi:hypothetical protein
VPKREYKRPLVLDREHLKGGGTVVRQTLSFPPNLYAYLDNLRWEERTTLSGLVQEMLIAGVLALEAERKQARR